jgi:hypothetical protein
MLEIHWPVVVHRWDEKGHYVPLTREDVRTYTYGAVAFSAPILDHSTFPDENGRYF